MRTGLERLAAEVLDYTGVTAPVDPANVARGLGLRIIISTHGLDAALVPGKIIIGDHLGDERRAFRIAHEIGHFLLRWSAHYNTEKNANYVASAILLPRSTFVSQVVDAGLNLDLLKYLNPLASYEALARRLVVLKRNRATIWDRLPDGRGRRYSLPYHHRPTPLEREAARLAIATRAPVEIEGVAGFPVIQREWKRAISIQDAATRNISRQQLIDPRREGRARSSFVERS